MTWAALLTLLPSVFRLLAEIMAAAEAERQRGLGRTEALAQALAQAREDLTRAKEARLTARARDTPVDPRLHDDGFARD